MTQEAKENAEIKIKWQTIAKKPQEYVRSSLVFPEGAAAMGGRLSKSLKISRTPRNSRKAKRNTPVHFTFDGSTMTGNRPTTRASYSEATDSFKKKQQEKQDKQEKAAVRSEKAAMHSARGGMDLALDVKAAIDNAKAMAGLAALPPLNLTIIADGGMSGTLSPRQGAQTIR
jgi:hypothetical protein